MNPVESGLHVKLSSRTMERRKKTYTIIEAAKMLGISRSAVHKAIQVGRLKARPYKVTEIVWRIDAESVRRYKISSSHRARGLKAHRPIIPRRK